MPPMPSPLRALPIESSPCTRTTRTTRNPAPMPVNLQRIRRVKYILLPLYSVLVLVVLGWFDWRALWYGSRCVLRCVLWYGLGYSSASMIGVWYGWKTDNCIHICCSILQCRWLGVQGWWFYSYMLYGIYGMRKRRTKTTTTRLSCENVKMKRCERNLK